MDDAQQSARCVRFGAFEFNPQIGELLKHGLKIKLSGRKRCQEPFFSFRKG